MLQAGKINESLGITVIGTQISRMQCEFSKIILKRVILTEIF